MSNLKRFSGKRVVWLQSPPWNTLWTRQNHFAMRMADEGAEILYVENSPSLLNRVRNFDLVPRTKDVYPGITSLKLLPPLPGGAKHILPLKINAFMNSAIVNRWLFEHKWHKYDAWCRIPQSAELIEHISPDRVFFDVTDDYRHFYAKAKQVEHISALQKRLVDRSYQIFTTTESLRAAIAEVGGSSSCITVVPNGVASNFFDSNRESNPLSNIPRPRIGYVGLIAEWVDLELLSRVASEWPGQTVSVGPVKSELAERYNAIPGLIRIPSVPYNEVPDYIHDFDVCIIPHKVNELQHGADLIKINEYLASGKPVVCTALRQAMLMQPEISIAFDAGHFISLIRENAAETSGSQDARVKRASERTWDRLFEIVASKFLI